MAKRGMLVALSTLALAFLVLGIAAYAAKDRILEEWYLWQLETSDNETRDVAGDHLVEIVSRDSLSRILRFFGGSEYLQARAIEALWKKGEENEHKASDLLQSSNLPVHLRPLVLVRTIVKAVDAKEKLSVLAGGNDQGVIVGSVFAVLRERRFVAVVKIVKVFPDLAGAEFVAARRGLEIQIGDMAVGIGQQSNESENYMKFKALWRTVEGSR